MTTTEKMDRIKRGYENFQKLYAEGVLSIASDYVHVDEKTFCELVPVGVDIRTSRNGQNVTLKALVDGVEFHALVGC